MKISRNEKCSASTVSSGAEDLDDAEWAGSVSTRKEGSTAATMLESKDYPAHELQSSLMMEEAHSMQSSSTENQDNVASWSELAAAPQGSVGDVVGYTAWNELPGGRSEQALPHQIDVELYGGMLAEPSLCENKGLTPSASEDDFMMYFDNDAMDATATNDICMGASDLAPPPMFPGFPGSESYRYY